MATPRTPGAGRPGPRRTPAGSRPSTTRPRSVAGSPSSSSSPPATRPPAQEPAVEEPAVDEPPVDEPTLDEPTLDEPTLDEPTLDEPGPEDEPADPTDVDEPTEHPTSGPPAARRGRRTTVVLAVVVVLLAALAVGEGWYLWRSGDPVVSSSTPVVASPLEVDGVVDQAARAAVQISSADWENYDTQVEEASALMTPAFAATFRETKEQVKEAFVDAKTKVEVDVAEQGVETASRNQVVALIFLTQTRTQDGKNLDVAQYKVEVTMVRSGSQWLVSDIQTL